MKPRLTTIALTTLALTTGAALAQLEPLTCDGPGATHDCRITLQPLDALAAAAVTPHHPVSSAELLLEQDAVKEARAELMHALTTAEAADRSRLYFLLGMAEARLGDHRAAANAFGSVWPTSFASRYNEAIARAYAGDHATGQQRLSELLTDTLEAQHGITSLDNLPEGQELNPTARAATNLILTAAATLHYMNQTPQDAVTKLEQLLKVTPSTPELSYLKVTAAIDFLPGDGTIFHAQQADPNSRDLLLGRAYAKAGMNEYAQQHYRAATQQAINAGDANALTEIAHHHAQSDQWPQAGRAATEALRYDPTNHLARTILALELENQGKHAEAATEHQRALQHGADPVLTHARLALAHAAAGDQQAAITNAEAALEAAGAHPLQSDDAGSMNPATQYALLALLARTHQALGELPEALAYADAASQHQLATPDMHTYAGDLAMSAGNPSAALTHYARADQTDPHVARAAYHAHLQLEQYELARQAANNLKQEAGETLHLIAWTYALEGDTSAAHQAWQRSAQAGYAAAQQILERLN